MQVDVSSRSSCLLLVSALCTILAAGFGAALEPSFADETYGRHQFDETERDHWAFLPVKRPEVPSVQREEWIRTPVDAFILAELEAAGLEPSPSADPQTLLRRAYLDLIGLPPTPEEQARFLADPSREAFGKVVDELLGRPEYGERWGRHWLDVVRYAETNGYERDGAKPHAWRYRDYVIEAFNQDKPYDRFVVEQLAGDELEDTNAETQIATTFLRLGPWDDEPADPMVDRYDQLDDVLGTTAAAFLGLSIRCARCHDHKYEPFTQRDYARLLAVFEPLKRPQDGRSDLDRMVGTPAELAQWREAVARVDEQVEVLNRQCDAVKAEVQKRLFESKRTSLAEEAIAAFQTRPDQRNESQKKLVEDLSGKLAEEIMAAASEEERANLSRWQAEAQQALASKPPEPPHAYVWYEDSSDGPLAHVFHRGDPRSPREEVGPGLPAVLVDSPPPVPAPTPTSTGRRKQLAAWLADAANPLTARVMVNRVWQHHFGEGIVATENDFGLMGDPPSHPQLLDWLASEFVAGGWKLKPLHRLIMLSACYQQSAFGNPGLHGSEKGESVRAADPIQRDPQNRLLWRWLPRRLEAEAIRDCVLVVSGQLNRKRSGPSVLPMIAAEVLAGQSIPGNGWKPSEPSEANRRSIYVFVKRTLLVPELEVFDFPNTNASCEQRMVSTIAPQALTAMNGAFMQEQSRHFAARLAAEAGDESAAQINLAFRLALCRAPSDPERQLVLDFLADQQRQIEHDRADLPPDDCRRMALEAFCLVLFSGNEFVYME
jgi:hypothetical protein